MSILTAIEPQARRAGRYNLFVDGQFVVGVSEAVLATLRLHVGQDIAPERLAEIVRAEEIQRGTDSAVRMFGSRDRSQGEIEARLRQTGYPDEVISAVIEKLVRMDLIDDAKFATAWVRSKTREGASRPAGRRRLVNELAQKGLDQEVIETALENVGEDEELALARAAAGRKIRNAPSDFDALQAERRKLIQFLQRRGFKWDVCKKVVFEMLPGEGSLPQ